MTRNYLLAVGCVLAVSLTAFFTNLGGARLFDDDEGRNATCGREMLHRGDWIVPTFNHELRTQKPVLLYWLMMSAYQAFGVSEFSARFPSALLATGTVLLTYALGRRLFAPLVGLVAGIALATSLMFDVSARAATPDSTLIFFATLALGLFAWCVPNALPGTGIERKSADQRRPAVLDDARWFHFIPTYAAMGFAVLAKGPVGVVLPTSILVLYVLLERSTFRQHPAKAANWRESLKRAALHVAGVFVPRAVWRAIWLMRPLVAFAVVGLIALPWYIAVGIQTDGAWLASFLGKENVGRFLSPMEGHRGPIFYYVIAVIIGFFPASIFLTPSLTEMGRNVRRDGKWHTPYLFCACWAGTYIGFFSLAGTKLPSYVLPAYPALALITAAWIDRWIAEPGRFQGVNLRLGLGSIPVIGIGTIIVLPIVAHFVLPGEGRLGLIGLILAVGGAYVFWQSEKGQVRRAVVALGITGVLFSTALFGFAVSQVGTYQNSLPVVSTARHIAGGDVQLATYDYFVPSLAYYAEDRVERLANEAEVSQFLRNTPNGFLVTRDSHLKTLEGHLPADVTILARQRRFLRSGEVILIGRPSQSARQPKAGQVGA